MAKTIEERAEEYVKNVCLDPSTYKGDVHTAYVIACMEQEDLMNKEIKALEERISQLEMAVEPIKRIGVVHNPVFGGTAST